MLLKIQTDIFKLNVTSLVISVFSELVVVKKSMYYPTIDALFDSIIFVNQNIFI